MDYIICHAHTEAERQAIYRFRYDVYIEEMGKTHIPADEERRLLHDESDERAVLFYARAVDKPVATVRALWGTSGPFTYKDNVFFDVPLFTTRFDHRKLAIVDRLIVDRKLRNGRLAHLMMVATYLGGLETGIRCCFIACETQLVSMYQRYGFRLYGGEPVTLSSGEKRNRLVLFLCDRSYLQTVRSPFLAYLPVELDDKGEYASKARDLLNPATNTVLHPGQE